VTKHNRIEALRDHYTQKIVEVNFLFKDKLSTPRVLKALSYYEGLERGYTDCLNILKGDT